MTTTSRLSVDCAGRTRYLYGGPYRTAARAESRLEDSFAAGDVTLSDRPDIVRRNGAWWIEVDG